MADNYKIYRFWNGKNIDGRSFVGNPGLIFEPVSENKDTLLKYEVGVDTFSGDELQK